MLKKHMAACLVASAFITMPVLAQTSTSPGATSPSATQPAPAPAAGGGSAAPATGASGRFITQQQQTQWRASRLIGLNVYGADNERIGDVNEVLVDRQGNADAVVVGVGGFLGIGEKNVALPFNAFEWQMDDTRRTAAAGSTSGSARTGDTAGTPATGGTAAGTTASTGTAGTAGTTASTSPAGSGSASGAARSSSAERGYPDHAVLRMTKADLENAPAFRYVGDRSSDSGASRNTGTGAGTANPGTTRP